MKKVIILLSFLFFIDFAIGLNYNAYPKLDTWVGKFGNCSTNSSTGVTEFNTCVGLYPYDPTATPYYGHATTQFRVSINFTLNSTLDTNMFEVRNTEWESGHMFESMNLTFEKIDGNRITTQNYNIRNYSCDRTQTPVSMYNYSYDLVEDVKRIKVSMLSKNCDFGAENYVFRIDEFNFSYYNFTNRLPQFNASISNFSYCLENTTLDIPLNLSASDPEGDVIYYAIKSSLYNNVSNSVNFNTQFCIVEACVDDKDFSLLRPLDNGECDINRKTAYNSSQHNLITRRDYFGNEKFMLELNSDCNRADKSYNHVLGPSTGLYFSYNIWDFTDTEELNLSYIRSDSYELLKLQLKGNVSKADLYYNNSIIATVHNPLTRDAINLRIQPETNQYQIVLSNGTHSETFIMSRDPFIDNVQYVRFYPQGKITLQDYHYQATVNIPEFSTTKPNYLTVTEALGRDYFTIFVTDSVHLETEFVTKAIPFTIYSGEDCRYVTGEGIGEGDVIQNVDVLGVIKNYFGKSLREYLVTLGVYEIGEKLLWVLFLCVILGLLVISGSLSLTLPLFVASIACGFIAFVVGYSGSLIAFLILIALSLAGPLAKIFLGETR